MKTLIEKAKEKPPRKGREWFTGSIQEEELLLAYLRGEITKVQCGHALFPEKSSDASAYVPAWAIQGVFHFIQEGTIILPPSK